jgi:phospholipase/carboxylesterase
MVASEVAYRTSTPLAGLILLSGTPVDEASWRSGYTRRQALPVFIAHGRRDQVLAFRGSERMQREISAAGGRVTWYPFDGGHEIPEGVVVALNRFLVERTGPR